MHGPPVRHPLIRGGRCAAGILYTSKETHYSVMKAARMYRMDAVEVLFH